MVLSSGFPEVHSTDLVTNLSCHSLKLIWRRPRLRWNDEVVAYRQDWTTVTADIDKWKKERRLLPNSKTIVK